MRVKKKVKFTARIVILASLLVPVLGGGQSTYAATEKFPTYVQNAAVPTLTDGMGDIAGSAFVDKDGDFHWMYSFTSYTASDDGSSWTKVNTNTDFGKLNTNWGTTTTYNSYWNRPGTFNFSK